MEHRDASRPASGIFLPPLILLLLIMLIYCSKGNEPDITGENDQTPPANVTDFHLIDHTTTTATLGWTAPGDDGDQGVAVAYDFRFSFDSITATSFPQAIQMDSVALPLPAGMQQICTIAELEPSTTYYFAFKTGDNADNWSGLSNCLRYDSPADPIVAFPDPNLEDVVRALLNIPDGDLCVSDLDTIREFNATNKGIESIAGMQYMISLTMLHLSENPFSDISPLTTMSVLEGLHLGGTDVTDLSPLTSLTGLAQLNIGHTPVVDISPLASLTELRSLRIDYSNVTDFSPLTGLTEMEDLNLYYSSVSDLLFVEKMTKLRYLVLAHTGISSVTSLSGLTAMEELYLYANEISDVSPLTSLTNLFRLDLSTNAIEDIAPLVANSGLNDGDELRLVYNPLSDESINTHIPALRSRGVNTVY